MSQEVVVGKLYMNGCGHCESLKEPWSKMESKIGGKIKVEKIESAEMDDRLAKLNEKHGSDVAIQGGYPTIFKIQNKKVEYYNGERTAPALIKWANGKESTGGKRTKRNKRTKKSKTRTRS
jgi:hypothetical protein